MDKAQGRKTVRKTQPERRTQLPFLVAAWLIGTLISLPSPGTASSTARFFITSYETALNLLENSSHLGRPLLESAYDSLHLYETCARTELSGSHRARADELLNDKLASASFAKAYESYKKSGQRIFSKREAKSACASLAKGIAH